MERLLRYSLQSYNIPSNHSLHLLSTQRFPFYFKKISDPSNVKFNHRNIDVVGKSMSLYSLADDEMENSYSKAVLYIPGIGNNLNNLRLADFLRKQGVKTYVLQSQNFFITELEAKSAADLIKEDFITVSSSGTQNLVNFHNERPQLYIDPILNPVYFFQSLPSNKSQSLLLDCISKLHDLPITSPDHDFPAFLKSLHYSSTLEFLVPFLPDPMKLHNNMIFYLTSSCSIPSTLNIPIIREPKSRIPFGKLNREMMVSSLIISLIS